MRKKQRMLIFALAITASSQFYLNFIIDGFRISTAVIILPVFLIIYDDISSVHTSLLTATIVFIVRSCVLLMGGADFGQTVYTVFPASFFYVIYGIIFSLKRLIPNNSLFKMSLLVFGCDFLSNIIEIFLRTNILSRGVNSTDVYTLFLVAVTRTFIAMTVLIIIRNYKVLLTKEEHEVRYQNLILLIADLKSEIYFMKKNSEDIEHIMSNSYIMYEKLLHSNQDEDIRNLSLNITKDIHDIKKDYIHVIKGIESTLSKEFKLSEMSIRDIFHILRESTYRLNEIDRNDIYLDFKYKSNFYTMNHFQLMSILKNIVNNAIESMDGGRKNNFIKIYYKSDKKYHIFTISDSGKGIAPQNMKYIYNPGFSTKFDYNTGDVNRGIGLYHVKALVVNHFKGTIHVASEVDAGTEFTIKIPIANMEAYDENIHY